MLNSVVNVMVKVVELGEVKEVKKDGETLRLRTVTLADKTGWVQPGGGGVGQPYMHAIFAEPEVQTP